MEQDTAQWELKDHGKLITITLPTRHLEFTADELAAFIHALGDLRSRMTPKIPQTLPVSDGHEAHQNPCYQCEQDHLRSGSLLHLRDPRYGWLHFLVPKNEARKLGEVLLQQARDEGLAPTSGKTH
jgi:hypothetical protein